MLTLINEVKKKKRKEKKTFFICDRHHREKTSSNLERKELRIKKKKNPTGLVFRSKHPKHKKI